MAYDYITYKNPNPQPHSPLWWVKDVIEYAKKSFSDKKKILLGIPFYGIDWNLEEKKARYVKFSQVEDMKKRAKNYSELWEPVSKVPFLKLQDENGKKHEIWFENHLSFKEKWKLGFSNEFGGVAFWRLTQEDPRVWDDFLSYLYIGQSETFLSIRPFERKKVFLDVINNGSKVWKTDEVFLKTSNPNGRKSLFFDFKTWENESTIKLKKDVRPGDIYRFEFYISSPISYFGEQKEYFALYSDNFGYLEDFGIHFFILEGKRHRLKGEFKKRVAKRFFELIDKIRYFQYSQ